MASRVLKVLVTGFEPFGGSTLNPSQAVAESLADRLGDVCGEGGAIDLVTALLPVDTERIAGVLEALWEAHGPDVVLHFGESAKADCVTLERVAVNLLDFDTPDNAGRRVVDRAIEADGPAARFATLDVRAVGAGLEAAGVSSSLSLSAGAYLCNQALYLSLGHGERRGGCRVGFVHVPSLPEQVERGERTGPTMARGALLEAAGHVVRLAAGLCKTE